MPATFFAGRGRGDWGNILYQQGVSIGHCTEELVLSNPSLIGEVHEAYYRPGRV